MKIEDFTNQAPVFRPEEFYDGRLEGWGVIEGPLAACTAGSPCAPKVADTRGVRAWTSPRHGPSTTTISIR